MMAYHKKPPKKPIHLSIMSNLIAQFGCYLNRAHDGEPGPTAIWVGLQRLRSNFKNQEYWTICTFKW